jgi:Phage integrase family
VRLAPSREGVILLFPQHQVHHPAPADVRPRPAAVVEDVGVVAPGVLQRVRQDRHWGNTPTPVSLFRGQTFGKGDKGKNREESDFLTYRDRDGRVADFHSLRHRFVTELVRAGVAPKDAKELARHSTITLTIDRYSHVTVRDTAAVVARLAMPAPRPDTEPSVLKATGTDGGSAADVLPDVPAGGNARLRVRAGEESARAEGAEEPLVSQGVDGRRGESGMGEGSMPDRS